MPSKIVTAALPGIAIAIAGGIAYALGHSTLGAFITLAFSSYTLISLSFFLFSTSYWKSDIPIILSMPVFLIFAFSTNFLSTGGLEFSSTHTPVHSFLDAFYFSVVTWTTLGYGDIVPVGDARWLAIIEALTGYLFSGLLIALIVDRLQQRRR